ncbi:chitinase-3-like protein 1 [Oratosquilla oratoria]|uniref:chitinase-3-like protein 1 n=1 Tax=Oratosquilla oratoria TaxID=337810 RepID=UPI003F767FC2
MKTLASVFFLAALGHCVSGLVVTCYYGSWAVWRPGLGNFDVEDIDPFLCTHVIFGFAGLSNHTWEIEVLDPWNELCDDGGRCAFDRFTALKQKNHRLKTILAVGGWNEGSEDYSVMVADPAKRKTFVKSSVKLVLEHNFDGLDVDWEYPNARGGVPADKENFVFLLDELRVELDRHNLLMTAALPAGRPTIDAGYDIDGLIRNLDFFHIMAYDYHGAWENTTHHNAPLKGYHADEGNMTYFNVKYTAHYWVELGVPKEKMVLGMATYGRCYTLEDYSDHGMLAPAIGAGEKGPYTRIPGTLGYNEICEMHMNQKWETFHDPDMCEPYTIYSGNNIWCGYDDPDSIYLKSRFAKNMGYAGLMVWTIDTDDFKGICHQRKSEMIHVMKEAFSLPADPPGTASDCTSPELAFTTTTTRPSTTNMPTPAITSTTQMDTTPSPTSNPATVTSMSPPSTTSAPEEPVTTPDVVTTTPDVVTTTPEVVTTATEVVTTATEVVTTSQPPATTTTTQLPSTTPNNPGQTTTGSGYHPGDRPNCGQTDQEFFPHEDCNKFWHCVNGMAILDLCSPGTVFNPDTLMCDWEANVDTSHCRLWICEVDNVFYPGVKCDEYYLCTGGAPLLQHCPDGLYWNQNIHGCDDPIHVGSDNCEVP